MKIRGFSEKTISTYLFQVSKFLDFVKTNKTISVQQSLARHGSGGGGSLNLANITKKDIKAYIAYLMSDQGQSPASVNLSLSSLRYFFIEVNKQNIFDDIKAPKSPKKIPTVLSRDEMKQLMAAVENPKHRLLFLLLYGSGLRVSEAVSLKVNDLDLDGLSQERVQASETLEEGQ